MTDSIRYIEEPSGSITDTNTGLQWLPKDSKQDLGGWKNIQEVNAYIRIMNQVYAGGRSDWRLPTQKEALSLYNPDVVQKDLEGKDIHISPFFVVSCAYRIWTSDVNEDGKHCCLNLRTGEKMYLDKNERENNSARLVRGQTS